MDKEPFFPTSVAGMEPLLDIPTAAKILGVHESQLRHSHRQKNPFTEGRPRFIRVGKYIRYAPSDLREFMFGPKATLTAEIPPAEEGAK